ncbi:soluble scavenger receptor cysteine-rich domain-containing protein SSC5D-like isoform X3 [Halichondria panicea]|uniref:soluble scavenger receptor cysteine-rich domain-containing protein SSC5D-like isoform X3 n=1 Tax=Halichondria panicea TaxID=6063 RepID=UPI00312B4608
MMNCLLWKTVTLLSLVWAVRGQSSGDLRLVRRSSDTGGSYGRLEVYYRGQWGTVCQDNFSPNDAKVACRQLGFSSYTRYGTVVALGFSQASSTTRTWLDDLGCSGNERILINCPASPIGVEDCTHSEDVALSCTGRTTSSPTGDLRLVDNSGQTGGSSGRLEFFYNGQWGTVCQDNFSPNDAIVACRQLVFRPYIRYGTVGRLGFSEALSSTRTWLDELRCRGIESRLINCRANTIGVEDCTHSEDVALICAASFASTASPNGYLRLVSNSGRTGGSSGRLEFYYNGQWGTVCQDNFDSSDARVACRQLGFSTYTQYGTVGTLGFSRPTSYDTRTWLDELRCRGSESRLIDCPANAIGVEDCFRFEDIALYCTGSLVSSVSIGVGVSVPVIIIIFVFVIIVLSRSIIRRRCLNRPPPRNLNTNTTSATTTVTNTQNTAYSMNQRSLNSNQPPPPNMHGPQPAPTYPTGQYSAPSYHTSYPQQPPAPYPQQPPAPEKPPPALYFSGGEAPPPYPG